MENKNGLLLSSVAFLIIGIFIGWTINGNKNVPYSETSYTHSMGNGQMMNNVGMDMDSMMQGMSMGLSGKVGDDFDKTFLTEMIMHHEGAIVMAQMVLKTSKRPELLQLAKDIITAQTKEIGMMQEWRSAWFR